MSETAEYLVCRLTPRTRQQLVVATPTALAVAATFGVLALMALGANSGSAVLILITLSAVSFVAAWSTRAVSHPYPPLPKGPEGWQVITELMRLSPEEALRDYVFVGTQHGTNGSVPVLIHKHLIRHHVHIVGASGTGKTARLAVPMCAQLMMMLDCSLLYIDLRGDNAAFRMLEAFARKAGMKIRFFSLHEDEAGALLCVLSDPAFQRLSIGKQAQFLIQSFGVPSGEGHGEGYFGLAIKTAVKRLLRHFKANRTPGSFRVLYRFLAEKFARLALKMGKKDFDNASHGGFLFEEFSDDPRLNMVGTEPIPQTLFANAITVDQLFQTRTLIYLKLPALADLSVARMLARLFLRLVAVTAQRWKGPRVEHVYIAIDEVQEALQMSLATPLRQIRDYSASVIYIHQSLPGLKQGDFDLLADTIENTAVKFVASALDDFTMDFLSSRGGERIQTLKTTTTSTTDGPSGTTISTGEQLRETIVPVIGKDELELLNSRDDLVVVMAAPDHGHTKLARATFIGTTFCVSELDYKNFKKEGWPAADGTTTVLASDLPVIDASLETLAPPQKARQPRTPAPATPSLAPNPKRKRTPKPIDPEKQRRADEAAERLRRLGGK